MKKSFLNSLGPGLLFAGAAIGGIAFSTIYQSWSRIRVWFVMRVVVGA